MISKKHLTIPNILSVTRLIGVPFLFVLIRLESSGWFIGWYVFLGLTDYFDGLIARMRNQVTALGAHLDSVADIAYYLSTAYFVVYLFPNYLMPNIPYLILFLIVFGTSILISRIKLGEIIFLHTSLSRYSAVLVFFAMLSSFFFDTTLFIRLILLLLTLGFIEICVIFIKYGKVDPDTRSILKLR